VNANDAVRAAALCPGDCTTDGVVNFNDLVCLLFRFGQQGLNARYDCDDSGEIDFNDLVCVLFIFGPC